MNLPQALPGLAFHALLHLLAVGTLVHLATGCLLRTKAMSRQTHTRPRARYLVALGAFLAAIALALGLQLFGLTHAEGEEVVAYEEAALAEASWLLGRSSEWPLLPPAEHDSQAWWLWLSIGPFSRALFRIWLAGIAGLTIGSAVGWLRFRTLRRQWTEAPETLRRQLDFPDGVALATGPGGTPMVAGLLRPLVYLPRWAISRLEPDSLRQILRHELSHVAWRDPLVDRCVRILRGLFWPVWPVWSLTRRVRREREIAADHQALGVKSLASAPNPAAIDYAETLLAVASRRPALVPLVGAGGELEYRVRHLLQPTARSTALARLLPVAFLLVGVVALISYPLPAGSAATLSVTPSGEDIRSWGALDHYLGFNPRIEIVDAPGEYRISIQNHELDAEQIERWHRASTLAEKAALVREAEALSRRAPPAD